MGRTVADLDRLGIVRPTLVLDRDRALRNMERMLRRAEAAGVACRPHFKTHQSSGVGRWFREYGVDAITVSSVEMARYFASDGWSDITIAFPVNIRELPAIAELAGRVRLGVLVDSVEVVEAVERSSVAGLRVWIKVDTGYGRAGVSWSDAASLAGVAAAVRSSARLELAGVLTHNGLTYRQATREGVARVHELATGRVRAAARVVAAGGPEPCAVSIGDTPGASVAESFNGVDEIRPGNFVFNDLTQVAVGACAMDDIAVAVACPVVASYPDRGTALLYGGAVHLSLDSMEDASGRTIYGAASSTWPEAPVAEVAAAEAGVAAAAGAPVEVEAVAPVVSLSQEHGTIALPDVMPQRMRVGGLLSVLPVHSCLTCNLFREYVTLDGERLPTMNGDCRP